VRIRKNDGETSGVENTEIVSLGVDNDISVVRSFNSGLSEYMYYDYLHSLRFVTDGTGALKAAYDYYPYGTPIYSMTNSDTDADPTFASHTQDEESGNYYAKQRYYDPETGRFNRLDPIMDGLNWYAYCGGDPVNSYDPWGLYNERIIDKKIEDMEAEQEANGFGYIVVGQDKKEKKKSLSGAIYHFDLEEQGKSSDTNSDETLLQGKDSDNDGITDAQEEFIKNNFGLMVYNIIKILYSLGYSLNLSSLGQGDDLGLGALKSQIQEFTLYDDSLRRLILTKVALQFWADNEYATEADLLGYMYEVDIFMFNSGDKKLSTFEMQMVN